MFAARRGDKALPEGGATAGPRPAHPPPARAELRRLAVEPAVRMARALITELEPETHEEQLRVVRIPAPTFEEAERAAYLACRFREVGLEPVETDEAGNVVGLLSRPSSPSDPPVILSAHLDTVFPAGTDLTPRRDGGRTYAPGIADNARGLAALVTLARALRAARIRTATPLWFAATVGEEGLGDLRGVKHLLREDAPLGRAAAFVALDGTGLRRIVHRAIGARRLRVVVRGAGGHSWADWGVPNPVQALGSGIAELGRLAPGDRRTATLTVSRIWGGTSVNSIPAEAWMELDLRSEDEGALRALEAEARSVVQAAVAAENGRRRHGTAPLRVAVECIGRRPSGRVPEDAAVVRAAVEATRLLGRQPELAASSTDANVPISLGIPAVTLGAGGESGGIHTLHEWYGGRDAARGLERALLTVLALAGCVPEPA